MFQNVMTGKAWKFGDNISTDLIMPGFAALSDPNMTMEESAKYCMYSNRPGWASQITPGDMIIAGKNFGCGSSRPGSKILKALGISIVICDSMSRLFFRNSINVGLAVMTCPGIHDFFEEGEVLEADIYTGKITSLTTGKQIFGDPLPVNSPPVEILQAGGLIPMLERQLKTDPQEK